MYAVAIFSGNSGGSLKLEDRDVYDDYKSAKERFDNHCAYILANPPDEGTIDNVVLETGAWSKGHPDDAFWVGNDTLESRYFPDPPLTNTQKALLKLSRWD